MVDHRLHHPPERSWDIARQGHGFHLHIHSAVPLFVSDNAMKPPHETISLVRRQEALTGVPVPGDFLHPHGSRNTASAPLIDSEFVNLVLALDRATDEEDL